MRIVNFKAGLGNQMFTYLFSLYLHREFPKERIYGSYWSKSLHSHNAFAINSIFSIELPPSNILVDAISHFCLLTRRLHIFSTEETRRSIFFDGYWLDKRYYSDIDPKEVFRFRATNLDPKNESIRQQILSSNSVSVHLRRGDYLRGKNFKDFGTYSNKQYYRRAIDKALEELLSPSFFIFSDDIDWAKANFRINNAVCTYVNGNEGNDSWKDLMLMSLCKHNIIANSTFSYWAAMLNPNNDKHVYYPKKWFVWDNPNIFPDSWMPIENL